MIYEIKHRFSGRTLFALECESLKLCVEAAVKAGANLADANLAGANLTRANLAGVKWRDGTLLTRAPLQIYGLQWPVTILDEHMQIGCELHTFAEWRAFSDRQIIAMDGKDALQFWKRYGPALLAMCEAREETQEAA
jgi:hypothetical protein